MRQLQFQHTKRFSLFLLTALFVLHTAVALHAVEHPFHAHDHDEVMCEHYFSVEHSSDPLALPMQLSQSEVVSQRVYAIVDADVLLESYTNRYSRAPPFSLQD